MIDGIVEIWTTTDKKKVLVLPVTEELPYEPLVTTRRIIVFEKHFHTWQVCKPFDKLDHKIGEFNLLDIIEGK